MTEEQAEAISAMREAYASLDAAEQALKFMEKELGQVNVITIKYRQVVKEWGNKFEAAQDNVKTTGASDELIKLL